MKIGVNARLYQNKRTGIGRIIESVFGELQGQKKDYIFFQTQSEPTLGPTVVCRALPGILGDIFFDTIWVNWLAWRHKVDVLFGPAHILPFFRLPGMKYVVTVHDLSFLVFPEHTPFLFRTYYRFAVGWSVKIASVIVADSKNTKNDLIRFYRLDPGKIEVVYPGLDRKFFTKERKRNKYLFTLSTHPKRKNIGCLVDLLARIPELEGYKLYLAGIIPEGQRKIISKRASRLGVLSRVKILGYVPEPELLKLYAEAGLFIFPSLYEGFGFPVLEAMASGSLVIAGNHSSLVELFPDRRFLVHKINFRELKRKIVWSLALTEQEKKTVVAKQKKFALQFSWSKAAAEYRAIFKSLIKK